MASSSSSVSIAISASPSEQPDLRSVFRDLRERRLFLDVSLATTEGGGGGDRDEAAADEGVVKAHKVLLVSSSQVLCDILAAKERDSVGANRVEEGSTIVVVLVGEKTEDVRLLVDFMYSGKVDVPADGLLSFMALAQKLKVIGLHQMDQGEEEEGPQVVGKRRSDVLVDAGKRRKVEPMCDDEEETPRPSVQVEEVKLEGTHNFFVCCSSCCGYFKPANVDHFI